MKVKLNYSALDYIEKNHYVFDGQGKAIDGHNETVHLLRIHNCWGLTIQNVTFKNGNTEVLRNLKRNEVPFPNDQVSIFEVIDGGAVIITGQSQVTFENCQFINNKSIMCGGAISNQASGLITLRNCLFENNTAGHTGGAIDDLVKGSQLHVENCKFVNNKSNLWHHTNGPHGQISIFPETNAEIIGSKFIGGSMPFDYYKNCKTLFRDNIYEDYPGFTEEPSTRKQNSVFDTLKMAKHLYWVIPKTFGKVYYRVNEYLNRC